MNCPCQSGQTFDQCCGGFISHRALPENAEQLMRSRYSANVIADDTYLSETWHPEFRPTGPVSDARIKWIGLEVIASREQQQRSVVEFEACFLRDCKVEALHEISSFVKEQERWFYTSGELLAPSFKPWQPGRNESCPCGSGKKFKRCCV